MRARTFWKTILMDQSDFLESSIGLLREHGIRFCVIGGHAVNAYVEPVVTLNLDSVVAVDPLDRVEALLASCFQVKRFAHRSQRARLPARRSQTRQAHGGPGGPPSET